VSNPSRLPDVLTAVRAILIAIDSTTEVLCGERYLAQEGASNRVLFVPDNGDWQGPAKVGGKLVAAINDTCFVYIWAPEAVDDFARYDAANTLRARVIKALRRVAPGRITPQTVTRNKSTNVTTYGEEYVLAFSYLENIEQDPAIAGIPREETDPTSPPDPLKPPGTPASTVQINISTSLED
jgi:hypothetical protein